MRRTERAMTQDDAVKLLEEGRMGVLSMVGGNGVPYGVPLNYCYLREENAVFFHCANQGRKMDNLTSNPCVSFAVVGKNHIIPEKLTTDYESVIMSGRARIIEDVEEKGLRFDQLCRHLTPGIEWRGDSGCRKLNAVAIVRIDIDSITGKKSAGV